MTYAQKNPNHSEEFGQLEGETCGRNGCAGIIEEIKPEGCCSCHITPPCSYCTTPCEHCPECDWSAVDDEVPLNGFLVRPANPVAAWSGYRPRPLNPEKIDWHSKPHTNSSMIKEGVFPFGTSQEEVRRAVDGTFGGRFERFADATPEAPGTFKFIAYTD